MTELPTDPKILAEKLKDPSWRLNSLYHVVSDAGDNVPFTMNNVQENVKRDMWFRNVVLKSRKHGLSTEIAIMGLDTAFFQQNQDVQTISDTLLGSSRIFQRIIVHSYNNFPDFIKAMNPIRSLTQTQVVYENGSIISVGTSSRSTSPTFLHISEFGKIACKTPDRANEILTGAIQSVAIGGGQMVFVEATAMGKVGRFKEMVDRARNLRDRGVKLSQLDMRLLFYPWYSKTGNRLEESEQIISGELADYFRKIECGEGMTPVQKAQPYFLELKAAGGLTIAQKKWYCTQHEILGPDMFVEHPSTEDEPFAVALEGTYFAHQFRSIYSEKRIGSFPVVPGEPVHTSWDIGMRDYMAIWFWQIIGEWAYAIDYYESNDIGLSHYVTVLESKGYRYGTHYAPHDINVKEVGTGKTRIEQAMEMGLKFKIVPKIGAKMDAIELARKLLDFVKFDEARCGEGIVHLEQYRKKWNPLANGWSDEPAKTGDQHSADALMTFAQGYPGQFRKTKIHVQDSESEWTKGKW